jgi:hypothetical protein
MSGFGAKVDMISGSINEVSRNSIWRQHVTKELRQYHPGGTFQIYHPNRLVTVEDKSPMAQRLPPMQPGVRPDTFRVGSDRKPVLMSAREHRGTPTGDAAQFMGTFRGTTLIPQKKLNRPMTSSHSIGWDFRPLTPRNPRFMANRRMCPETVYADRYATMTGFGPFNDGSRKAQS